MHICWPVLPTDTWRCDGITSLTHCMQPVYGGIRTSICNCTPTPHDSGRDTPMAPALNSQTAPSLARSPRIRVFELLLARAQEIGVSPGRVTPSSSRSPISRPRAQTHSKPLFSNLWQSKGLFCSLHLH